MKINYKMRFFFFVLPLFLGCSSLIPQNLSHGKNGVIRSAKHLSSWNEILIYFEDEYIIGKLIAK